MLGRITKPLLAWYDSHARVLPWREEPTPYRVWVSEIMLQQTRVEAVKPYFTRFVEELPDVAHLAAVSDDRLMKLWEGLGYYSRARNLKKAAMMAMEEFGGYLPSDYDLLLKLPGIGPYTAGAIASIAFHEHVPAVDGNVLRVITRLTADDSNTSDSKVKRRIEQAVYEILPKRPAGHMNQALMELGATICLPNGTPKCQTCPLSFLCEAHRQGNPLDYPQKNKKKERRIEEKTVLLLCCDGKIALRKRPDKGLLAGLYEYPTLDGKLTSKMVENLLRKEGEALPAVQKIGSGKHIFTHVEWHMVGYRVELAQCSEGLLWVTPEALKKECSVPSAFRFIHEKGCSI